MDPRLLAPCSLYCGVCGIQTAYRENDAALKEKLAALYGVKPEDIACEGCRSEIVFAYCRVCPIVACTTERGLDGCHECDDFPCERIDNFPIEVGKRVILRAVPQRRELGTEMWVESELARYGCPSCGAPVPRGFRRCRQCRTPLALD